MPGVGTLMRDDQAQPLRCGRGGRGSGRWRAGTGRRGTGRTDRSPPGGPGIHSPLPCKAFLLYEALRQKRRFVISSHSAMMAMPAYQTISSSWETVRERA